MRVGRAIKSKHGLAGDRRFSTSLYFLVPMMNFVGCSALFVAPVQVVGVGKFYGVGVSLSGALLTAEILCSALVALLLSSLRRPVVTRQTMLGATILLVISQFLSGLGVPLATFVALRVLAGLSAGALYAFSLSLAAADPRGIRMLCIGTISSNLVYGVCLVYWPPLIDRSGVAPLFIGLTMLTMPLLFGLLMGGKSDFRHRRADAVDLATGARERALPLFPVILLAAVCILGNGGFAMLWSLAQLSGEVRGFALDRIGMALGLSTLTGISGSIVAGLLGWNWGIAKPLMGGLLVGISAGAMVALSAHFPLYLAGILVYGFATFLVVPYMLSMGGLIEPSGRAAMIAGSAIYLSGGLAPAVGGAITDTISIHAAEWGSSALVLLAALSATALVKFVRRPDRRLVPGA